MWVNSKYDRILLASTSLRRKQLLEQASLPYRQIELNFNEDYPSDLPLEKIPSFIAKSKAMSASSHLKAGEILLTADSIVIIENKVLGKPLDEQTAFQYLEMLSNKKHVVVTGICLYDNNKFSLANGRTEVVFDKLEKDEIAYYLKIQNPLDKAGAYGIQDWLGWVKIRSINGSYSNVMGLPMALLYRHLQRF